jgi:hypothetical protein
MTKILVHFMCFLRVIEAHPSLGHAAMMVAAAINEENSKGSADTEGPAPGKKLKTGKKHGNAKGFYLQGK